MPLIEEEREWYIKLIKQLDQEEKIVVIDENKEFLKYSDFLRSDETLQRYATDEELVRCLSIIILLGEDYGYSIENLYVEKYYQHGHPASKRDEVDLIIFDQDELPFAMWEFKSPEDYDAKTDEYIRYQLFGTAPLVGAPRLLVYATIKPSGQKPYLSNICIDYTKCQSFDSWVENKRIHSNVFPSSFIDLTYEPFVQGGNLDLRFDCTQADFRAAATTFHMEFFSEHPDNTLFTNLVKCLLAKIYDERQTKKDEPYEFQVMYKNGKEETAEEVFIRINTIYKEAYKRYIQTNKGEPDEINPNEFSPERVKTVVKVLQSMSITRGSALYSDIIGAFFEEILRTGFKQDKGMYFTHSNLVWFMLEAIDLEGLAIKTWQEANHPDNRLPYVIDPACGSGAFLLRAMQILSNTIRSRKDELVTDFESQQFFSARMSDEMPNYWAEHFIYGMDPKFIMAITAKVNMVLHGDGSAHIFNYDALKTFSDYKDDKLKPVNDPNRSIPKARYNHDMAESFDVVVSNPPFGINLSSNTKMTLPNTFSLRNALPSECFFFERWFQLLKPNGRVAVVLPESILNSIDNIDARLMLYRMFWIRAIVSLPRNLFIETPTLTSLLFAQKKVHKEIQEWDDEFDKSKKKHQQLVKDIELYLKLNRRQQIVSIEEIKHKMINKVGGVTNIDRFTVKGRPPLLLDVRTEDYQSSGELCNYYLKLLRSSAFTQAIRNQIFKEVVEKHDYEYPLYMVDEVGYKLSKRKERIRPNQLCRFIDLERKIETPNLHMASRSVEVRKDKENPERILDFIRRDVHWT